MKPPSYHVLASAAVTARTAAFLAGAGSGGEAAAIALAYERIMAALRLVPLDFGEDRGDLEALGLKLRIGFLDPLLVRYGVHEVRRIVWIQEIRLARPAG